MHSRLHDVPLNAVRAYSVIARELSVTKAAKILGITQSSASRHLAVLEDYLGATLVERQGRSIRLTAYGQRFADAVRDPIDSIAFSAQLMRRSEGSDRRLTVRTSIGTFAQEFIIPQLSDFLETYDAIVDFDSNLAKPGFADTFDVLLTRDLALDEPGDEWNVLEEHVVCAGAPHLIQGQDVSVINRVPLLMVNSRPDILPLWLAATGQSQQEIRFGARFPHHHLAIPAAATGQGLYIGPESYVYQAVNQGRLNVVAGSKVPTGMTYRAIALDRSSNPQLAHDFCRWLVRLARKTLVDANH